MSLPQLCVLNLKCGLPAAMLKRTCLGAVCSCKWPASLPTMHGGLKQSCRHGSVHHQNSKLQLTSSRSHTWSTHCVLPTSGPSLSTSQHGCISLPTTPLPCVQAVHPPLEAPVGQRGGGYHLVPRP